MHWLGVGFVIVGILEGVGIKEILGLPFQHGSGFIEVFSKVREIDRNSYVDKGRIGNEFS